LAARRFVEGRRGVGEPDDPRDWPMSATKFALTRQSVRPTGSSDAFIHDLHERLVARFQSDPAYAAIEVDPRRVRWPR
jgi:hypothetical protein